MEEVTWRAGFGSLSAAVFGSLLGELDSKPDSKLDLVDSEVDSERFAAQSAN